MTADQRPVITRDIVRQREWYNDVTLDAVVYLHANDPSFFRLYKDYPSGDAIHYSVNDAKVQEFYGLTSYHSFNQINHVRFLGEMGLIDPSNEWQTRWLAGYLTTERVLHSLVSLKYILTKDANFPGQDSWYDPVASFGPLHVFRNRYYLPLGYSYDSYVPMEAFHGLDKRQKAEAIQKAVVVDEVAPVKDRLARYSPPASPHTYTGDQYAADIAARRADTLAIGVFRQNHIRGTIRSSKDEVLFFSIPFDKGWAAKVDGVMQKPLRVNVGFLGLQLGKGDHTIELDYTPPFRSLGMWLSIAAIMIYCILIGLHKRRGKQHREMVKNSAERSAV